MSNILSVTLYFIISFTVFKRYKELLQWLAIGEDALHVQEPLSRDFLGKYDSEPFDNAQITDSVSFIGEALVAWAPEFMNKMFYMLQSQVHYIALSSMCISKNSFFFDFLFCRKRLQNHPPALTSV